MEELVPINCYYNNTVPFEYFVNNFLIYSNCDKYFKEYRKSSKLDSFKKTLITSISKGISLLNEHKINVYGGGDGDSRISIQDLMRYIKK